MGFDVAFILERNDSTASSAICEVLTSTVVKLGMLMLLYTELSNPVTETSSGTRYPFSRRDVIMRHAEKHDYYASGL